MPTSKHLSVITLITPRITRLLKGFGLTAALLIVAGCTPDNLQTGTTLSTVPTNPISSQQPSQATSELIAKAESAFEKQDYQQALTSYQAAIDLTPSDANAWFGLAAAADMLGNFDLADQAYTKLSDSHQHTPRFLNNLGYSHMLRGELLVAREYFVKVFAVDPDNARAQSNLEMLKNLVSDDQNNGQD